MRPKIQYKVLHSIFCSFKLDCVMVITVLYLQMEWNFLFWSHIPLICLKKSICHPLCHKNEETINCWPCIFTGVQEFGFCTCCCYTYIVHISQETDQLRPEATLLHYELTYLDERFKKCQSRKHNTDHFYNEKGLFSLTLRAPILQGFSCVLHLRSYILQSVQLFYFYVC